MQKISEEETINRTNQYESILSKDLNLDELNEQELVNLFSKIVIYLKHDRNGRLLGRTPETFDLNINKYVSFCKEIGFSNKEIIENIEEFVSILHIFSDNFMYNYYLCSVLENEENTYRREKLKKRAKDLMVDHKRTYARLMFMESIGYKPSWDNLLKRSDSEFADLFVKDGYSKPHKILKSKEDLTREILLNKFPVDMNYIETLSKDPINSIGHSDGYGTK